MQREGEERVKGGRERESEDREGVGSAEGEGGEGEGTWFSDILYIPLYAFRHLYIPSNTSKYL